MTFFDKDDLQKDMNKAEARSMFADMLVDAILETTDNEAHRADMLIFKTAKGITYAVDKIVSAVYLPEDRLSEKKQALEYLQLCLGGIKSFIESQPFLDEIKE